ncbi:hypothetical protein, partial [Hydrogenophaga atypica]|uniref:hypothetical protein n=1 Tax=Hydrogenophaga atypica TaxID=249409 RepID=UPI0036D33008
MEVHMSVQAGAEPVDEGDCTNVQRRLDLCPRLKELKQRHLFVPRGTKVPAEIAAVCEANVDVALIEK